LSQISPLVTGTILCCTASELEFCANSLYQTSITADNGYIWARYVSWYAKANLYNYAVSGAVCSNNITPRLFSQINAPFPAVREYEVPAFIADKAYIDPTTKKPFLDIPPDQTAYALWIGTNDLGNNAFLTDSQVKGKTLNDYVDCVFSRLEQLYTAGGRYFVLMNVVPLNLAPQYATPEKGGVKADKFWPDKPSNLTAISLKMAQQVQFVNEDMRRRAASLETMAKRYPDGHFALFDTHRLVSLAYPLKAFACRFH
jgi:hypothetical protein